MSDATEEVAGEIERGRPGAYAQARFDRERRRELIKLRAGLPLLVAAAVLSMVAVFLGLQFAGATIAGAAAMFTGLAFAYAMFRLPMDSVFWLKGAKGEEKTGAALASLEPHGFIAIYGRQVPGRNKDIDAVVVGPTGLFVVETKNWKGPAQVRNHRLWVGESDRTAAVAQIYEQAIAVQVALSEVLTELGASVTPILALSNGRTGPERVAAGVEVVRQSDVANLILARPAVLDDEAVQRVARAAHVRLPRPRAGAIATRQAASTQVAADASVQQTTGTALEDEAFERLRAWRLQRSRRDGVAAFMIFSDRTLRAIAERQPTSLSALLTVPGVGTAKFEAYGREVLDVLAVEGVAPRGRPQNR